MSSTDEGRAPVSIEAFVAREAPGVDQETVQSGLALAKLASRATSAFEWHFGRFGLTRARFETLLTLAAHGDRPWTQAELAEHVGVSRPSMTAIVDVLARDLLVARTPHPADRRKKVIKMTDQGEKLIATVLPAHFARLGAALETMVAAERGRADESIESISGVLDVLGGLLDCDS